MTKIIQIGLISLGTSCLIGCLLYKFVFEWVFKLQKELTPRLREEILPDIAKSTQLFTTLSSAAIVLSFSVLKGFATNPLIMKHYLMLSWIFFVLAVLLGMFLSILIYVFRANYMIMVKLLDELQEKKQNSSLQKAEGFIKKNPKLGKYLFLSIYIQALAFASGIVLMTVFALLNI